MDQLDEIWSGLAWEQDCQTGRRLFESAVIEELPDGHSHRRAQNISLCFIEHVIGLIHEVAHKRGDGATRVVPAPNHCVPLVSKALLEGLNEALLASGGYNVFARYRDSELLDVLSFNLSLNHPCRRWFDRMLGWQSPALPDR